MDKLAQKSRLDWKNRIREKTNLTGKHLENQSPDFLEIMDALRTTDEEVREIVVSETGENDLKDSLKVARSNFNRREYVNTVILLGKFHQALSLISGKYKELEKKQAEIHNNFLFDEVKSDPEKYDFLMKHMPETFKKKPAEKKAAIVTDAFIKEAGIGDIWHNLTTDRGRALKAWEKRFPKFAKTFKRETEKMINRSENQYQLLTTILKRTGILRAHRKVEEYLAATSGFVKKFEQYHAEFQRYYDEYVGKLIETQKSIDERLAKSTPAVNIDESAAPGEGAGVEPSATVPSIKEEMESKPPVASVEIPVEEGELSGGAGEPRGFPPVAKPENDGINPQVTNHMKNLEDLLRKDEEKSARVSPRQQMIPAYNQQVNIKHKSERVPGITQEMAPDTLRGGDEDLVPTRKSVRNYDAGIDLVNPGKLPPNPVPKDLVQLLEKEQAQQQKVQKQERPTFAPKPQKKVLELIPQSDEITDIGPLTQRSASTDKFLEELATYSETNPLLVANKIVKFANSIAKSDKETSDKLLSIAKNLLSTI